MFTGWKGLIETLHTNWFFQKWREFLSKLATSRRIDPAQEAEEFLYIVTHDLKAFARAMRAIPDWIVEDISAAGQVLPPEAQSNFAMLQDYAKRMDTTLDALTDLSRVGRISDATAPHSLQELVTEAYRTLPRHPVLCCTVDCNDLHVLGPRNDLTRLFNALLENAVVHHDRDEGVLNVTASQEADRVVIRVSDDGPGIPPDQWENVFKPLSALRPKSETGRAGLGLSLARKVVHLSGGDMRIVDTDGTRGCAVEFDLPFGGN